MATQITFQSASTSNAAGSVYTVRRDDATIGVQTVPAASWDGTVNFEGSIDGVTYFAVLGKKITDRTTASTATAASIVVCPVAGLKYFQCRTSGRTTGNVTVIGHTSQGSQSLG